MSNRPCYGSPAPGWPVVVGRLALLLGLFGLMTACSLAPSRPPITELEVAWQQRQHVLQAIEHWRLAGRAAVKLNDEGGQANLRWYQQGEHYELQFLDPLGRRVASLEGSPQEVILRRGQQPSVTARDAQTLLARELGWRLPVAGLKFWVLGVPQPGYAVDAKRLDAQGRARWLQQNGWRVDYGHYERVDSLAIPHRLTLSRAALKVTLVIDQWQATAR